MQPYSTFTNVKTIALEAQQVMIAVPGCPQQALRNTTPPYSISFNCSLSTVTCQLYRMYSNARAAASKRAAEFVNSKTRGLPTLQEIEFFNDRKNWDRMHTFLSASSEVAILKGSVAACKDRLPNLDELKIAFTSYKQLSRMLREQAFMKVLPNSEYLITAVTTEIKVDRRTGPALKELVSEMIKAAKNRGTVATSGDPEAVKRSIDTFLECLRVGVEPLGSDRTSSNGYNTISNLLLSDPEAKEVAVRRLTEIIKKDNPKWAVDLYDQILARNVDSDQTGGALNQMANFDSILVTSLWLLWAGKDREKVISLARLAQSMCWGKQKMEEMKKRMKMTTFEHLLSKLSNEIHLPPYVPTLKRVTELCVTWAISSNGKAIGHERFLLKATTPGLWNTLYELMKIEKEADDDGRVYKSIHMFHQYLLSKKSPMQSSLGVSALAVKISID